MKHILTITLFAFCSNVFAVNPAIYCKDAGQVHSILANVESCQKEMLAGAICFVGNREEVIGLLNSDIVIKKFMNSAEYIGEARAYKNKSITYVSYGEANDPSSIRKIDRCSKKFFSAE